MKYIREERRAAWQSLQDAKLRHARAVEGCAAYLQEHPPKSFVLQEAYQNPDGSFADPHWNETAAYETQNLIDYGELDEHILNEGEWTEVFRNPEDDPRPGFRRVINVTW